MALNKYSTKYVLLETNSLNSILSPLKGTQRIKYTCFDVSENFIVFGATSGGIYIFSRDPCHFLQLLPNKDGSLNNVSISPDEKFVGFSTSRGVVAVLERTNEGGGYLISRSDEHGGTSITSLIWSENSNQLYIADDCGQLSVINISVFINKSIFQLPSHIIIKLDSEIFQVSCCGELLLVSTRTRFYICDTVKEQYKQIGTKLREGIFGASFIKYSDGVVKAFCARPGSRLWEVNESGSVLCTHQFKEALTSSSSITVSSLDNKLYKNEFPKWQDQSINFPYLLPVMDRYLFTFKNDSFYIFDPEKVELIVQCNKYSNVVDARCIANRIYTWNSKGLLREFILTPVENCLVSLYFRGAYSLCVELCENFIEYIKQLEYNKLVMMTPLLGLTDHIDNFHLNNNLSSFFINLKNCCNLQPFKFNLNDSIDSTFMKPEDCDKPNSIFSCSDIVNQTSNFAVNKSCGLCQHKNVECVHNNYIDKNNIISNVNNDVHNSGFLVDNSPYYSSDTSHSPEVSLSCVPAMDSYNSVQTTRPNCDSKSFNNNSEILINKFNFTLNGLNSLRNQNLKSEDVLSDQEELESIVDGREIKEKNSSRVPSIDISPLVDICDTISKSENSCKVELFAQFLTTLNLVYIEYKDILNNKKCGNFPLNEYLTNEYSKVAEQCFYDIINSGDLIDCLKLLPDELKKPLNQCIKYPDKLITLFTHSGLVLDTTLSNIIFLMSDTLNPFIILELLDSINLPCSFLSWYSVLNAYQDNTFDYITEPQDSYSWNHWPLPIILNIIFLMLRLDQIESVCYMSKEVNVSIKDISYLTFRHLIHLESSGVLEEDCYLQARKLFLSYLANLTMDNNDMLKEVNVETVKYIESFLLQDSRSTVCENCNFPIGESKSDSYFDIVGVLLLRYYLNADAEMSACDTEAIDDLSNPNRNEFYNCYNQSINKSPDLELNSLNRSLINVLPTESVHKVTNLVKAIPKIVVHLIELNYCKIVDMLTFVAQFNLLHSLESYTCELVNKNWITLCECYKALSEGLCCICDHTLSSPYHQVDWNTLASSILLSIGPVSTVKILNDYSAFIPPDALHLSFYRTALLGQLLSRTQDKDVCNDIMKTFHGQFVREPIDSHLSQLGVVSMWEAESSESIVPSIVHSKNRKHWGITLDVNTDICSKCSLVLNSESLLATSDTANGIRGFRCGHTFHVLCLRLSNSLFECSICS